MNLNCVKEYDFYQQGMTKKELVDGLIEMAKSAHGKKHALMVEQMDDYRFRFAECEVTD